MKKARISTLILALCLLLAVLCPAALADSAPEITAKSAIVIDRISGTVLYEKDADAKAEPASTTKIMTLLLICEAVENGDVSLDDKVTANAANLNIGDDEASTAGIKPGEVLSLRDLCYCAMLFSANEACNVAANYVSGSAADFVALMNKKADELGCKNTHFENANGLPASEHYTTARELAIITQEALKYDFFKELCGTIKYLVPATNMSDERVLSNSNALINNSSVYGKDYMYEGAYGVKTGHTEAAGYCLVSAVDVDGFDLISVVLGSDGDGLSGEHFYNFEDSIKLLDFCRENYKNTVLIAEGDEVEKLHVEKGAKKDVALSPAEDIVAFLPKGTDPDSLDREITVYKESIIAPVNKGAVLGSVTVKNADGVILGTSELVASNSVRASLIAYSFSNTLSFIGEHILGISLSLLVIIVTVFLTVYIPAENKGNKKK